MTCFDPILLTIVQRRFRSALRILHLATLLGLCIATLTSAAVSSPSEVDAMLREIVTSGHLAVLRWPDFSDYQADVRQFYDADGYALAWSRNGQPTSQAQDLIEILQHADSHGLRNEDYDGPRWKKRIEELAQSYGNQVHFDVALTVSVMRYVSDLRVGRVNPRHFKFNLDIEPKKYDLPEFLAAKLVNSVSVKDALADIEPPFAGYKRTLEALDRYLELSSEDDGETLPLPPKTVEPGGSYDGTPRLVRLLRLLGDLLADASRSGGSNLYDGDLVDAVKHFQQRHGLAPDGRIGAQTITAMNVPLAIRVQQLRLTLERWRWVPYEFTSPPIVVNIPEFRLRAYGSDGKVALGMNVIVGKAYRHETPVFERDMKYIVFRPYWNVPRSIQRSEIVPAIRRNRNYIAQKNYEVITSQGTVVTSGVISDDVLTQLETGKLLVRQKPGPSNALGLVKLMFPNEYNVYLHSTPAPQLFSQARRDFSHGCIRVEEPAELVEWVLRHKPEWTLERVQAAMQSGPDNSHVNLNTPVPVLILYGTAIVDEQNVVHFFHDLYGYDASLEKILAAGYPYP
jgi:murein L,D-transpeptidase YcbB/YkuD